MQQGDFRVMTACAPDLTESLVALGTDIALLIDQDGVVSQVAQSGHMPMSTAAADWVGRRWVDTVTHGTRAKIDRLLGDVRCDSLGQRREVNHAHQPGDPGRDHAELPVAYTAMRMGTDGPVLALGRDLRSWVASQSRMLSGQRLLESDYWHQRQAAQEQARRARLLHQAASQPAAVVCGSTFRLLDANAAAIALFSEGGKAEGPGSASSHWLGRPAQQLFDSQSWPSMRLLLQTARRGHRMAALPARLASSHRSALVGMLVPPGCDDTRCLLHLDVIGSAGEAGDAFQVGVLVTDAGGRILCANAALAHWLGLAHEDALRGQALGAWLDGGHGSAAHLLQAVGRQGLVHGVPVALRNGHAKPITVRLSAHLLGGDESAVFGFELRRTARREALSEVVSR